MKRLVHWKGTDEWRAEAAEVELADDGVAARGVQLGVDPLPYRLDYELDATQGWVTQSLKLEARGADWSRRLLLGFSPLTNLMPIRRGGLDAGAGTTDHLMAWVSVPDLEVFASAQRYQHVRLEARGSIVRFVDRGRFEGFTAELRLDGDGLATEYPGLARMVGAAT